MPKINFDDPAVWAKMYNPPFTRANRFSLIGENLWSATHLRQALEAKGMTAASTVGLLGGGYGWVAEEFIAAGYTKVIVCDTSSIIQANKALHAVLPVLSEDGLSANSRRNIKAALGKGDLEKIDWIITEDVLPCLTDNEVTTLIGYLRAMANNVGHWVSPWQGDADKHVPGLDLNWKTIADWKTLVNPDWVVSRTGRAEAV